MITKTKTKSVEGRVFFVAFLIFAAVIIGAVKSSYDDYLRENYFVGGSEYRSTK